MKLPPKFRRLVIKPALDDGRGFRIETEDTGRVVASCFQSHEEVILERMVRVYNRFVDRKNGEAT